MTAPITCAVCERTIPEHTAEHLAEVCYPLQLQAHRTALRGLLRHAEGVGPEVAWMDFARRVLGGHIPPLNERVSPLAAEIGGVVRELLVKDMPKLQGHGHSAVAVTQEREDCALICDKLEAEAKADRAAGGGRLGEAARLIRARGKR